MTTDELQVLPDKRHEALKILRSQGYRGLLAVEKLLGWQGSNITGNKMAQQLGLTKSQLHYMLFRKEILIRQKERRLAKKEAGNVAFVTHTSSKLGFSISFPSDWRIGIDRLEAELGDTNLEEGLFQVSFNIHEDDDTVNVDVTKLRIPNGMTPHGMYELNKLSSTEVPWGAKPHRGIVVDGLQGIMYYFLFDNHRSHEKNDQREMPEFFNVYLAGNGIGWIISSSCKAKRFNYYKPVFRRIVDSFRRS